jgi:predicted DNA-binding transcriptional regulator YafY
MGPAVSEGGPAQKKQGSIELTRHLHASHFPLARLIQLILLLQTERCPNARQLAEICEVSRRTIYRDLAALTDAGVAVIYRPDRQGYQLARSLFLQPPRIEEHEALALLVLCRQWLPGPDLGLSRDANRAVDKLVQSLPDPLRGRLLAASEVLEDPPDEGETPGSRHAVHDQLLAALSQRRQVRLWVREGHTGEVETTKMGIYRLAFLDQSWCMVGRSSRHCRVVLVPILRLERVELTADPYVIPPRFNLERFLARKPQNGASQTD